MGQYIEAVPTKGASRAACAGAWRPPFLIDLEYRTKASHPRIEITNLLNLISIMNAKELSNSVILLVRRVMHTHELRRRRPPTEASVPRRQLGGRLCATAVSLLLGRIGRWSGREMDALQAERLDGSCLSVTCSALSLARSARAERDNSRHSSIHKDVITSKSLG
ncbi:hypothetical protein EVAR_29843_1 [Eumeta japonica]|uniref:Uncharacterized protein n=1 Tax=Eumeta variegata TaxID=151549 RepID=A0A4C1VWN6_EUMVA|nr:hypothetical protein EVAR_29843_1 [Eumeta japonica]